MLLEYYSEETRAASGCTADRLRWCYCAGAQRSGPSTDGFSRLPSPANAVSKKHSRTLSMSLVPCRSSSARRDGNEAMLDDESPRRMRRADCPVYSGEHGQNLSKSYLQTQSSSGTPASAAGSAFFRVAHVKVFPSHSIHRARRPK